MTPRQKDTLEELANDVDADELIKELISSLTRRYDRSSSARRDDDFVSMMGALRDAQESAMDWLDKDAEEEEDESDDGDPEDDSEDDSEEE